MFKELIISEIHAGSCRCENNYTGTFVKSILSYKEKRRFEDENGVISIRDVSINFGTTKSGVQYFPAGLLGFVKRKAQFMLGKKIHVNHFDASRYDIKNKLIPTLPDIKFENYQSKMLRRIGPNKKGLLVGPTGMGKSIVLGGIIDKLYCPNTIVIVPTRSIAKQLYSSFSNWFGDRVGMIGDSLFDQRDITICLFQSLNKYTVSRSDLRLILLDEAHLINNTIIRFMNQKCTKVFNRYGVTATPHKFKNNMKKTFQMMGCFGDILCEVTDTEASKRVLPVNVFMISYYCHKPKGTNYKSVLREDILFSKLRNAKLLQAAEQLALKKNMTVLILVDETKQGKRIKEIADKMGLDPHLVHGKMKGEEIDKIKRNLNDRKIKLCIATKVFGVGTDIPNVDCVVLASTRKSEIDTLQKIGRGRRRVGKDHLILIDCIDKIRGKKFNQYFYGYSMERLKIYKEKKWEIQRMIF